MSKERGTFMIGFAGGEVMVFGNNYKPWWMHAREFIYRNFGDKEHGWRYDDVAGIVEYVKYSNQPFYDDGGLKWCDVNSYQQVIDEVCERDKLAPVKMDDIVFTDAPRHKATLTKKLKEY
jgi:hypothetical protein